MPIQSQSATIRNWHSTEAATVLEQLDTQRDGLTTSVAEQRLLAYGPNRLRPPQKQHAWQRFLQQFNNVLIYVLLGAGLVTALLGHWVDSGVIVLVVLINAIIGFIQEGKAEKALEAIRNMLAHQAMVRRDGTLITLSAEQLVPGDIVSLQSGDKVPADLRLFKTKELRIDEAILTGESVPANKVTEAVVEQAIVGDRRNIAFSGTFVSYGQGLGVVVATGDSTELGRISGMLGQIHTLTTPLLRQMSQFGQWLSAGIGVLASLTFAYGVLFQNFSMGEMFLAAVGLAVAAIPEGLPAIMTITLAIGVQRMAHRNAIIRRLPAVETLGSVTVICSDKTGTLTRNEMTVKSVALGSQFFEVSGVGYDPHGSFSSDQQTIQVEDYPVLKELTRAALLCNDASLIEKEGRCQIQGDPTEGALVTLGMKAGLDPATEHQKWPRTDVIPFESEHRFMATLHHDHTGHAFVYVKGAPERVLDMCLHQRKHGEEIPLDRNHWETCMASMAGQGHRLLAIAFKAIDPQQVSLKFNDVDGGLTLLGIVGIIDPPRSEATAAVAACKTAGIRVKMITGDHSATALSIGLQMGIGDGRHVVKGTDINTMDDATLQQAVQDTDVFARTSPEHKLRLVQALQAGGEVVSMTGDGVNDAPALKRADVGVAMGQKGTEVAKEAAEMVLTDDNFASIAHAVEEGRTVYDNLKKSILFILPTNGGEAMTIIAAIAMGRHLPITPVQILWINMITAVTLALALAFEPSEANVMRRPPRIPNKPLLSPFLIWRILFVSLILVSGTFGIFLWERMHGADLEWARTVAVNTLVMFEVFYLLSARYLIAPAFTLGGNRGNRAVIIAITVLLLIQLGFTYLPFMQQLFGSVALDAATWLRLTLVASSVLVLVELEKAWLRRYRPNVE